MIHNVAKNPNATAKHIDRIAFEHQNEKTLDHAIKSGKLSPTMQDAIVREAMPHVRPRHVAQVMEKYRPSKDMVDHLASHPVAGVRELYHKLYGNQ